MDHASSPFGSVCTWTAIIGQALRVLARFNTTRTAAQPAPGPLRTYTLETSPYRHAMIELAKNVGATFALSVIQRPARDGNGNGNGNNNVVRDTDFAPEDPQVDRVTETDLAKLFDITPRQLVDTRWVV